MREELRLMEIIEQYLSGNMTPQEKEHFEKRLQQHPHLRQKVEEQKALQEGLDRYAIRQQIKKAYKAYQLQNFLKFLLPSLLLAGIIIGGIVWYTKLHSEQSKTLTKEEIVPTPSLKKKPRIETETKVKFEEKFDHEVIINANLPNVLESKEGVLIVIPKGAFLDGNGQPVKGEVDLKYAEAISPEAIIEKGLSTVSDSNLLETGGMFNIAAFQDGKPLKINPDKGIYVEVPTNNPQSDMRLYDGIQQKDGSINWKNPKLLANFLVPVDITTLDFYPPAFLDSVASLGLDVTNKQLTDSLYYSLSALSYAHGESLFRNNCAACHKVDKKRVGPALKGIRKRWPHSEQRLMEYIQNTPLYMKKYPEDKYAKDIFHEYNNAIMPPSLLTTNEIQAILEYVESYTPDLEKNNLIKEAQIATFKALNPNSPSKVVTITNAKIEHAHKNIYAVSIDFLTDENFQVIRFNSKKNGKPAILSYPTSSNDKIKIQRDLQVFDENGIPVEATDRLLSGKFTIKQWYKIDSLKKVDLTLDFHLEKTPEVASYSVTIMRRLVSLQISPDNFQLSPLSIRSIWDTKFNNSNLATREFEKRMHTIHQTCNEEVLNTYIQHLDQPLWYADSLAASKTGGELNAAFTTFKNERAGKVKGGERFAKALGQYYKKQKQAFTKALRQTLAKAQKEREQEAKALQKHQLKDNQREEKNFQKEFQLNWKKVRKELGIKNARIRRGPSYRAVITTPGWKNIDRQVFEATVNRESATFSYKGKTSSLTYEPLEVEVKNVSDETNLKVYLLPKELYSFQRMHKKGQVYNEKLNMDFKYDVLVVQFEHNNVHYFEQKNISPGHITVELTQTMTKEKWKKKLRRKYPRQIAKDLKAEQEYMELIQKRTARIKQEKEQLRIQEVLKYGAFPCLSKTVEPPISMGVARPTH